MDREEETDRLAELWDIADENRLEEYVLRSPDAAASDLRMLLSLPVWTAFGYSIDDGVRLEGIVDELVEKGAADDRQTARRAIAAVCWRPLAAEIAAWGAQQRNAESLLKSSDLRPRPEPLPKPSGLSLLVRKGLSFRKGGAG